MTAPSHTAPAGARNHPPTVLATGAWLKNTACLLERGVVSWSAPHGDLGDPSACAALEASLQALLAAATGPVEAVAHDLHPDFFSTRLALQLAESLQVPAIGVQHHHAHIAAVMAEHGLAEPVVGLALDGVGLGVDGQAWGGELLWVAPQGWRRLGHLWPLALAGGDAAAREPWRMAAAALHALGRGEEIEARFGAAVGTGRARQVGQMLARRIHCPPTSSAGRWFDAAAAALGLSVCQAHEAEAAIALQLEAEAWIARHGEPPLDDAPLRLPLDNGRLDLRPLLEALLAPLAALPEGVAAAAARFHLGLADALAAWAADAADAAGAGIVCLGGGCFLNRLLRQRVTRALQRRHLRVYGPDAHSPGDAGLALGQAWVAAQQLALHSPPGGGQPLHHESMSCV